MQGEVESISMMPSKGQKEGETGLLEYIEEIIGSDRYRDSIKALHAKYVTRRAQWYLLFCYTVECAPYVRDCKTASTP